MRQRLTYMIVDDNPLAIEQLHRFASVLPQLDLAATETDSTRALDYLHHNKVDLLFVDVEMPGLSGLDLVRAIMHKPMIVFVTAHASFAVDGFDLGAVDFLRKPLGFDRFVEAVHRVCQRVDAAGANGRIPVPYEVGAQDSDAFAAVPTRNYKYFRSAEDRCMKQFYLDQILFFEASRNVVKVYLHNESFEIRHTFSEVEELLSGCDFYRVHRSFIVNLHAVEEIYANEIGLRGRGLKIRITEKYWDNFEIMKYRLLGDASLNL